MKHRKERSAGILPNGRGGRDGHAPFQEKQKSQRVFFTFDFSLAT
jgi:hypothetical protein